MPAHPLPDRFAFGDFVLERSQQRVVHRDGTALDLPPRLFGALQLFIDRAGELLHAADGALARPRRRRGCRPGRPAMARAPTLGARVRGLGQRIERTARDVAMEHAWREVALCRESGSAFAKVL